jgi:hypothetical protein
MEEIVIKKIRDLLQRNRSAPAYDPNSSLTITVDDEEVKPQITTEEDLKAQEAENEPK